MTTGRARLALVAVVAAFVLVLTAQAGAAQQKRNKSVSGIAGGQEAACLGHVVGGQDPDWQEYYTHNCTGHDEPELDPVSSAAHSAFDINWHVALPAGASASVASVGPTFWFGGTVKDSNPAKIGGQGFLELQFYPDSFTKACKSNGGFVVHHQPGTYTACSPVWTIAKRGHNIAEPAAFNGMITNVGGGAFVMHGRDVVDVHIWAPSATDAYREQVTDETTGETSDILVLNSPTDGPLTPAYDTQDIGNSLDWGGVWDTPMAFVWEIGHSDLYGDHPGQFCIPGQTFCGSFNHDNWAGLQPIRIFDATFGDGSHPQHWAAVTDTGGKAEVLGNSFVGPTTCAGYGGPFCIYPWYSWDGQAYNFGVEYPNTVNDFHKSNQFAQNTLCPSAGVFAGGTYCDTILN